ncbi:SLBB domain-containing protein [Candidatus Dependentiae bacterium]|nr:SLBB domain-containing protein [Candidatus Dependentiae bacterium]
MRKKKIIVFFEVCILLIFISSVYGNEDTFYYKIKKHDILKINIYPDEKQSVQREVSDIGSISIPLIGNIKVENLSIEEVQNIIKKKLEYYYYNPDVIIELISLDKHIITVAGYRPANIDGSDNMRNFYIELIPGDKLSDLLIKIGWEWNTDLKYGRIIVIRNQKKNYTIDLLDSKTDALNYEFVLENKDVVFFEKNSSGTVKIIGFVNQPKTVYIPYHSGLTVLQAALECGGFKTEADLNSVKITRFNYENGTETIILNLYDEQNDTNLLANDVVEIPELKNSFKKTVTFIGITNSGIIELDNWKENSRLSDVIGKAKFNMDSKLNYIFGINSKFHPPVEADFQKFSSEGDITHNPLIYPGDVITAKTAEKFMPEDKGVVSVLGNFVNQGRYPVNEFSRLADVLIKAGWQHKEAEPVSVLIISSNSVLAEYDINKFLYYGDANHNPVVNHGDYVYVRKIQKNKVFIVGQVINPGYFELETDESKNTLARYIYKSGGPRETAAMNRIKVVRDNMNIDVDLNEFFYAQNLESDFKLKDKDIVYIPSIQKFSFYVFGMVNRVGRYDSDKPVTVLEALTIAGGYKYTGKVRGAKILRGARDNPQIIDVDLLSSLNDFGYGTNLFLQEGDILYVPKSPVTNLKDFLDNIVPSLRNAVDFGKSIKDY